MTEGLPGEPVVGDRYLVPDGMDAVRTFTTDAAVASGSEAGNPPSAGAYVVDVTTAPWRHSKVIVLGRTAGESQDPLAEEGWFSDPEAVAPGSGELAGTEGSLVATPPIRPRAWFDLAPTEVVAIEGLVDPATAEQLWTSFLRTPVPSLSFRPICPPSRQHRPERSRRSRSRVPTGVAWSWPDGRTRRRRGNSVVSSCRRDLVGARSGRSRDRRHRRGPRGRAARRLRRRRR